MPETYNSIQDEQNRMKVQVITNHQGQIALNILIHTSAINSLWKCLRSNSCYSLSITRMLDVLIWNLRLDARNWVPSTSLYKWGDRHTENQLTISQGSRELSSESTALCSPLLLINTLYPPIKSLLEYWFFILSTSFSMIHFRLGKQCLEDPDTLFSMKAIHAK